MIVHKILDNVFATWSNIAVLRVLSKVKTGLSGREIAKQANMSAPSSLEALTSLENLNIVTRQRGGREHFFYMNREHYLVTKIIIPVLNAERKFAKSIYTDIDKGLGKYSSSLIVFGSTARREEDIESDLDLCVVFKDAASKKKIEKVITDLSFSLNKKYGVSLAPFHISEQDFAKRAKNKKSPVTDIIKEGRHISGKTIKELTGG
jgi:predicted nucleotidyltransferase